MGVSEATWRKRERERRVPEARRRGLAKDVAGPRFAARPPRPERPRLGFEELIVYLGSFGSRARLPTVQTRSTVSLVLSSLSQRIQRLSPYLAFITRLCLPSQKQKRSQKARRRKRARRLFSRDFAELSEQERIIKQMCYSVSFFSWAPKRTLVCPSFGPDSLLGFAERQTLMNSYSIATNASESEREEN